MDLIQPIRAQQTRVLGDKTKANIGVKIALREIYTRNQEDNLYELIPIEH